jgi:hypothetical protein
MRSTKRSTSLALTLVAAVVASLGCSDLSIPSDAIVFCQSNEDCPINLVCRENIQRCVDPDLLNAPGIELEAPLTATRTLLGAVGGGYDSTTLRFSTTIPPTRHELALDGEPISECTSSDGLAFSCTLQARGDEDEGAHEARITVWDELGNERWDSVTLVFDYTAPRVAEGTVALSLLPAADNPLDVVENVKAGTTIEIAFALDEPTSNPPAVRTAGAEARLFQKVSPAQDTTALAFVYRMNFPDNELREGTWSLHVDAVDDVGNAATSEDVAAFTVDLTPPPAPATQTPDAVVYTREPWGTDETNNVPRFVVEVAAGGVEANAVLVVYDDWRIDTASELGRAEANAAGAIGRFQINRADRPELWVTTIDRAGNESEVDRVRDTTWVATLGGKVAGSLFGNPHSARAVERLDERLAGGIEVQTPGDLRRADGSELTVFASSMMVQHGPGTGAFPERRFASLVADRARGTLVLIGGDYNDDVPLAVEWDGRSWHERSAPVEPTRRWAPAAAWDARRGVVVVFGGQRGTDYLGDTWELDGNGTWHPRTPDNAPPARAFAAMEYDDQRGVVVLFGGHTFDERFGDTWEFDGEDWSLRTTTNAPSARGVPISAWDGDNGRMWLYGGFDDTGQRGDLWFFDGDDWTEQEIEDANAPPGRAYAGLAWDHARDQLVLHGGHDNSGVVSFPNPIAETWTWDATDGWQQPQQASLPIVSTQAATAWDPRRQVVVHLGGWTGAELPDGKVMSSNLHEWDGTAWQLRDDEPLDAVAVQEAQVAYDPTGERVVLYSGLLAPSQGLAGPPWPHVREWDGESFTELTPQNPPLSGAWGGGFVWDRERDEGVLFGGVASGSNTAWRYTADDWVDTGASGPTGLELCALAWDDARKVVVLFGGDAGGGPLAETWTWNGATWSQLSPATAPPARSGHGLSWDPVGQRVLLFGGEDAARDKLADTWAWDGTTWTELVPTTSPPPRTRFAQAFERSHGLLTIFGGYDQDNGYLGDAWSFDGTSWHERPLLEGPGPRFGARLVYDEAREELFLFGGNGGFGSVTETFTLSGDAVDRPAVIGEFFFSAAGANDSTELLEVTALAVAGATGATTGAAGSTLVVWDRGAWQEVANNDASADDDDLDAVSWTTTDAEQLSRLLYGEREGLFFGVVPTEQGAAVGAAGRARVTADYLEVTVRYREP